MGNNLLLLVIASTMLIGGEAGVPNELVAIKAETPAAATNSVDGVLKNGKATADLRLFYFDRGFDDGDITPNASTFTLGGIVKYESGSYYGLKFGLAYYGNFFIAGIFDRIDAKGASMLDSDNNDLSFLGEGYLQYDAGNTMLKVGRQQLDTPLINGHDLRMLPSVYEAATIRNTDISDTMLEVGYIKKYTGFASREGGFEDFNTLWGEDGLAYLYATNKSIESLTVRGQYVKALSDTDAEGKFIAVEDYMYADAEYALSFGTHTYIKGQAGGNTYTHADNSKVFGVKTGTTIFETVDMALLYDKISGNAFKAVEAGPLYSDWQQGYGPYEPSTAFGAQIGFQPLVRLSLKFAYVDVSSDTDLLIDDYGEFNFDGRYTINDYSSMRIRYSYKNQSDASEALVFDGIDGNGGREDRYDFRIIYYLNFSS